MKYQGYMPNDFINGEGVSVSLWTSGCPHHCEGCFNPETWDKDSGVEIPTEIKGKLVKAISANGIIRNLSILGGEPLAPWNIDFIKDIVTAVRIAYPQIKIFLWTGYVLEDLKAQRNNDIDMILSKIDVLIDGPFQIDNKDTTLKLRGSSNQRILYKGQDF